MSGKAKSKKDSADFSDRVVARNRRASFNYELGKSWEAGLVLVGSEVRSLRENTGDLTDAWVDIRNGEAFVLGMRIPPLTHVRLGQDEKRTRKLLLHREEIDEMSEALERERCTLVATKLYFKAGRAKVEVTIGRGKKQHDKRQTLRERDAAKEARDAIRKGKGKTD
jgi:SsrA-binding protein